jgi:aldehyde dehydrogenase (NAD(P)+)
MVGTDADKASRSAPPRPTAAALAECRARLRAVAADWVAVECRRKDLDPSSALAFEEWTHGPLVAARSLALWERTLAERERGESCRPRAATVVGLPALPFDALLFRDYRLETRYRADAEASSRPAEGSGRGLVLAAGNVSALAVTDCLQLLCSESQSVTVKLPPSLAALAPMLREVFAPMGGDAVEILVGDAALARTLALDESFTAIHLTGAGRTLAALERTVTARSSPPRLTAELGNVTPLIVVPLAYRPRELRVMVDEVAAMLTHHGGFNCVTPRVIVTAERWSQRAEFLARLRDALAAATPRTLWYPGAVDNLHRAVAASFDPDRPVHSRLLDAQRRALPPEFAEECFAPVAWQLALEADDLASYLDAAVDFCNQELFGTLAAQVFVPTRIQRSDRDAVRRATTRLEYGTLAINCWAALGYAFAASPWGGVRASRGSAFASGRGFTNHRRIGCDVERTTIEAPLRSWPVPIWRQAARAPRGASEALLSLTLEPSVRNLPSALTRLLGWTAREPRVVRPTRSTTATAPERSTSAAAE